MDDASARRVNIHVCISYNSVWQKVTILSENVFQRNVKTWVACFAPEALLDILASETMRDVKVTSQYGTALIG